MYINHNKEPEDLFHTCRRGSVFPHQQISIYGHAYIINSSQKTWVLGDLWLHLIH
jgi:hypothetical protein